MVDVTISNNSDANFELRNTSKYTFMTDSDRVRVPAHGEIKLLVKPGAIMTQLELSFVVQNALTAPKQSPSITLEVTNIETVEP